MKKDDSDLDEGSEVIFVKVNGRRVKIILEEILWIEAQGDYVLIESVEKSYLVLTTMKAILARLPDKCFARSHRKYIVRIDAIEDFEDMSILVGKKYLPVGASHKKNLVSKLSS